MRANLLPLCLGVPALLCALSAAQAADELPGQSAAQATYVTPYAYAASVTDPGLTPDFQENPRAISNYQNWSLTPYSDWQNFGVIQDLHSTWGPDYIHFKAPAGAEMESKEWFQRRVVAAASVLRNTVPYGHHHISVWDVPDTPEWTDAGYEPGYAIDCSDFTHFAYSYGAGIDLKTGVIEQAELASAPMYLDDGSQIQLQAQHLFDVDDEAFSFNDLVGQLEAGDLLYIRSDPGLGNPISHVIMWMGDLAYDTNGKDPYLIMDSHGDVLTDSNNNVIPSGPELRPFTEDSYYFGSFDHVVRYFPVNVVPEPATVGLFGAGAAMLFLCHCGKMRRRNRS